MIQSYLVTLYKYRGRCSPLADEGTVDVNANMAAYAHMQCYNTDLGQCAEYIKKKKGIRQLKNMFQLTAVLINVSFRLR